MSAPSSATTPSSPSSQVNFIKNHGDKIAQASYVLLVKHLTGALSSFRDQAVLFKEDGDFKTIHKSMVISMFKKSWGAIAKYFKKIKDGHVYLALIRDPGSKDSEKSTFNPALIEISKDITQIVDIVITRSLCLKCNAKIDTKAPTMCTVCLYAPYCSLECRSTHKEAHKSLCPVIRDSIVCIESGSVQVGIIAREEEFHEHVSGFKEYESCFIYVPHDPKTPIQTMKIQKLDDLFCRTDAMRNSFRHKHFGGNGSYTVVSQAKNGRHYLCIFEGAAKCQKRETQLVPCAPLVTAMIAGTTR